jgi:glucans biosynthesis protein C
MPSALPPKPIPPDGAATPAVRLAWVDNLRTAMILLVVNMHACVTYGHVGSWYRMEGPDPPMSAKIVFLFWQGHMQAFFMGLLFFVAGMFAQHSLERRGPGAFLRERARRLGLPSLFYMLVIHPFMIYVLLGRPQVPDQPSLVALYGNYVASGRVFSGNGPMWFALALLFFCAALAGRRTWTPRTGLTNEASPRAPSSLALASFAGAVVLITFGVRILQPCGTSVLNFQLSFFTQYVAAFAVGVAAGRRGWLEALASSRRARIAGWLGLIGGPLMLATIAGLGGPPPEHGTNPYFGGWNVRAFAFVVWEQFAGLGLALGVIAWFHHRCNASGRLAAWLSERSFGVYLLHAPVLVALTPLLRPAVVNPFLGMLLLTATGLIGSFVAADLAKRLPGLGRIL